MSAGRMPRERRAIRRFTIGRSLLGHEVLDSDGRPVATRDSLGDARADAAILNRAAEAGSRTLAKTLATLSNPRVPLNP